MRKEAEKTDMCGFHTRLWQILAINPDRDSLDNDADLYLIRQACQAGQTCDGARLAHADPTALTALAHLNRTNRTLVAG